MRRTISSLAIAALVFGLAFTAFADGEKVAADKLPKAIVDSLKAKFPAGQFKEAEKYNKDGKACYEVEFTIDGSEYDAIFSEDGTLKEYCKEIKVKDLPKVVTDAIAAKYPKSEIEEAEEHFEGTNKGYKLEIETEDGKEWCIKTDLMGKVLEAKTAEDVKKEKEGKK